MCIYAVDLRIVMKKRSMEMKLAAEKPDQTVYEGEAGGYYAWTPSKLPLLREANLAASKLLLYPLGFALPHLFDSNKVAFVLQGECKVGLVAPNSSDETVVVIKKGDVLPLPRGMVSWWYNGGPTNLSLLLLGETSKGLVPGEYSYFMMAGPLGVLRGFGSDVVAKVFDLSNKEAEDLVSRQPAALMLMLKLRDGTEFPKASEHVNVKEKLYTGIDTPPAEVSVKGGGIANFLTQKDLPTLGGMGLSAKILRLEGNAVLAPSYVADGALEVIYVAKGSGRVLLVGNNGKLHFDGHVEEGGLLVLPQYVSGALIADEGGIELYGIMNSSEPNLQYLAGNVSLWKTLSSVVLESAFNISPELAQVFKSKNTERSMIIPPRS